MAVRNLVLFPGDGIGPEAMAEVEKIIAWMNEARGAGFETDSGLVGGSAYDAHGKAISEEDMAKAMAAVRAARAEGLASVLGLHFEGPFIDSERKGAHAARFIRELTDEDANIIASAACGTVLLTLAPNRVRPELIRALTIRGVIVSLGHAEASHAQCQAALAAGATCFTHLFNAMSQVNGREPGMVGSALADSDCFVSIIADGFHVHDATLKVAIAAKRKDRMILVSDAMPSAAGGPDQFELQGRPVTRRGGRLELDDGTLAGSDLTMDAAVRHCVNHLGMTVADALRMATRNPAALLGRGGELGRIAPGYLANLVHLGEDLTVREVWTTDE